MTHLLCASENGYNTNYTTPDPKFINGVSEANELIILGREWYNSCYARSPTNIILLYSRIVFIWGKLAFPTTSQVGVVDTVVGCHPGGPGLIPDCVTFLGWNFDFRFEFFSKKFSKFLPSDSRLIMKSIIPLVLDNTNYSPVAYNGTTNIIQNGLLNFTYFA